MMVHMEGINMVLHCLIVHYIMHIDGIVVSLSVHTHGILVLHSLQEIVLIASKSLRIVQGFVEKLIELRLLSGAFDKTSDSNNENDGNDNGSDYE
jgi:hypothetical protein